MPLDIGTLIFTFILMQIYVFFELQQKNNHTF